MPAADIEILRLMDAAGARLEAARRIVLTTHVTPDGDGLGSALALCRHLRARGKTADVINCSSAPHNLRFLYDRKEFFVYEPDRHQQAVLDADVIVATDLGGAMRLGRMEKVVRESRGTRIIIDHHVAEYDCFDVPLIRMGVSSSAEITYDLIKHVGGIVTPRIAQALYAGLVTDTGNFSYASTTVRAHQMAAELVEAGVDPHALWRALTCTMPLGKLHLLGNLLSRISVEEDGLVAWTSIDGAMLVRSGVQARDAFEVVNHLLHLDGSQVGVFFVEISESKTKVSLRSAGMVDVCALARGHGGGGHRYAAGCTVDGHGLKATIDLVLEEIHDALRAPGNGTGGGPAPTEDS